MTASTLPRSTAERVADTLTTPHGRTADRKANTKNGRSPGQQTGQERLGRGDN
jgi:hypothetical protein